LTVAVFERVGINLGDRVELHVFGCSPEDPMLHRLKDLPNCVFHGKLLPSGVCQLLSITDVFADFSEYQAMGLTTLEAMGCGAAVVAPGKGGSGEFVKNRETGLLIDTSDEEACYQTLVNVVENAALRKQLCLGALGEAVQYFPERSALAMMRALFDQ
jgi:glycosyltransferase involved in cell wall biosynthesis